VRRAIQGHLSDIRSDARHLEVNLRVMSKRRGYRHLQDQAGENFSSFEAFCREPPPHGLGYDRAVIERIIKERKTAQAHARQAVRPAKPGRPAKGTHCVPLSKGNNDRRVAQIARVRPDILERMKKGEFKSVRAAAIDAGIIKPPTPAEQIRKLYNKLDAHEREEFLKWVSEQ
jgi:hypothetical protein